MDKNLIAAMLLVFIAVKNPIGLPEVNTAHAEPHNNQASAQDEANIALAINDINVVNREQTTIEKAEKEIQIYQKTLAEEQAKRKAEEAQRIAEEAQRQAKISAQHAVSTIVATTSGGFESIYAEAEMKYGVPRQIIAAVHLVETGQRGDTTIASYAGAQGPMQFMPSTFAAYAQDGDGDGVALINDVHDAIYTGARYLAANGGASGNIRGALYRYNHSYSYVEHVLSIARSFGFSG